MNRRLTRLALAAALTLTAVMGFAGIARADTVVMGSKLVSPFDGGISNSGVTAQLSFDPATSTNPVVSPVDGVITSWKVKSADDGARYTLKVLRPNGPVSLIPATNTNFSGIASVQAPSAIPAGTFTSTPTGAIFDYPASLPISKGDYLGVRTVGLVGGGADGLPQAMANGLPKSTFANNFASQPADGASANLLADAQHELLLQATIEFEPDVTPPGNPASPVNPAGNVRTRKCKKKAKHRSAQAAKKKAKKKCKKKHGNKKR
jgi:hypothetical protein